MAVEIFDAKRAAADWFLPRLRAADVVELTAASGPDLERTLHQAIERSPGRAFVAVDDILGPICLFGFAPYTLTGVTAAPWAVGTEDLRRRGRPLNHFGRLYCQATLKDFDLLANYVDDRHVESVRWLSRIGFDLGEPQPFGVEGLPFRPFEMRRDLV